MCRERNTVVKVVSDIIYVCMCVGNINIQSVKLA